MIREIRENDLVGLMELYTQLHDNPMTKGNDELLLLWQSIIDDKNHHIIIAEEEGKIVASCVVIIIPNLTHNQQSYALVENVITDKEYRSVGLASACLNYAKEVAIRENCYKIMLLTGSKEESVFRFYEKSGYNQYDKTAFIQWI